MKSVYSYTDFRRFLTDHYTRQKRAPGGFSFRRFTRETGVKSPNYLKLVMDGKRALTPAFLFRFAKGLGLNHHETQYFESLVHFNQATDALQKSFYRLRLKELKQNTPRSGVKLGHSRVGLWYEGLIQLLLDGKTIEEGETYLTEHLGKKIPIAAVIKKSLAEGILAVEDGRYRLKSLFTEYRDKTSRKISFEHYIKGHLEHALGNFSELYPKGKFVCHSFTVAKSRLDYYRSLVSAFLLDINRHSEDEPAEELLQLNVQLYPLRGEIRP